MISYLESGQKAIRPENLIRLCHTLLVSADRIAQKTAYLEPRDFRLVEEIIYNCIALADKK